MKKIDTIKIEISGPTQSGKTAIMETIRQCLAEDHELAVVFAEKADRINPPRGIDQADQSERPKPGASVIVLAESNEPRSGQE